MPYIVKERRVAMTADQRAENAGELNFRLTVHMIHMPLSALEAALEREIEEYLSVRPESYALYNEVVGALDCCRREFLRRRGADTWEDFRREERLSYVTHRLYMEKIAPYEDTKIEQNGDVF